MRNSRLAVFGVAAVAALCLTTAGCGTAKSVAATSASPSPSASPSADLNSVLLASVTGLKKKPFAFTLSSSQLAFHGEVDGPANRAHVTFAFGDSSGLKVNFDLIAIDKQSWVKIDFGDTAKIPGFPYASLQEKWLHLDETKMKGQGFGNFSASGADPASAETLFKRLVAVENVGAHQFKGTMDLTGIAGSDSELVDADTLHSLGSQAKALPFQASLDDQGRLVSLEILIPASGSVEAQTWKVTYSDYGVRASITEPRGAIEAPSNAYDLFNG